MSDLQWPPGAVYFNVSEDGHAYEQHRVLGKAMGTLRRHPEDHIVIVLERSSHKRQLTAELTASRATDRRLRRQEAKR